jgi:hypothetical protein
VLHSPDPFRKSSGIYVEGFVIASLWNWPPLHQSLAIGGKSYLLV